MEAFEYEPEGFRLRYSGCLPDFWLSDRRAFLEIKPDRSAMTDAEVRAAIFRARDLAETNGFDVYLAFGAPDMDRSYLMIRPPRLNGQDVPERLTVGNWPFLCPAPIGIGFPLYKIAASFASSARFEFGEVGPPDSLIAAANAYVQEIYEAQEARRIRFGEALRNGTFKWEPLDIPLFSPTGSNEPDPVAEQRNLFDDPRLTSILFGGQRSA
jgi:hypothetical protein